MSADEEKWVPVGKINGLFGVKGWMKIYSSTEPRENILSYSPWFLKKDGQWQEFELLDGRAHGKGVVASLSGISDRDRAAELIGSQIAIRRSQLPATEKGEYYWSDLQGMNVVNLQGEALGKVISLFETGANDVMVVRAEDGKKGKPRERLIPFLTDGIVHEVDSEQGIIQVDWDADF